MIRAAIIGTGSYVPGHCLTNDDLAARVETSDEWITTRTGIRTRCIARAGEETSKMAAAAARGALEMAGLTAAELDMIVVATITPDMTMPSCACLVQKELGAEAAFAFDINAACSGFVYGLDLVDKYIRQNPAMKVLLIGAETLSARVNWQDRTTCVLFGDGAGAVILTGTGESDRGYVDSRLYSDGRLWQLLYMDGAPSLNPALAGAASDGSYIRMAGPDVFRYAVRGMEQAVVALLERTGVSLADIALVIPHQANIRILKSLADKLGLPLERFCLTIHKYGNTSAASIPVALDEANRAGRLKKGDLVLFCVFGGGFTWGAALLGW
jgi:3-oxoacyl-[acyl-carrier-protein] synthase-3